MRPAHALVPALAAALLLTACGTRGEVAEQPATTSPTTAAAAAAPEATAPAGATTPTEPADAAPAEPTADEVVEGDGFRITFPSAPSVETVDVPLAEGLTTQATIYQAQVDGAFLGFSHADTPDTGQALDFDPEEALQDSARGAATNSGGEVSESAIITFLDRPAIDYLVTVPGGSLRGIAFFDGVRLYTGQLVAAGDVVDRAPLDAMMASLELG